MFWVDELVEDIINKKNKDEYLITDWKTPSGHVHIGSLTGVSIHEMVRQGLEKRGKKAIFQYGFDDYDPMDGFPVYLDESFRKYMGMPLSNIPAPDGKSDSYADQYANEFTEVINGLGYQVKFVRTSHMYKSGFFDEAIKITLDNAEEIRDIYFQISGSKKDTDWYPLNIVCPKCGRVGTTKVVGWDGKKVKFQCLENFVTWAKGCGHEGEIEPFGGNAKLPWKVEWPAKFYETKTDIEGEGKDHATKGGSREIANAILRKIYKQDPPYDIPYEWILISGAGMSSSKGIGASAKAIYDFLPGNILRFLFAKKKYKRTIDFNPEGKTLLDLYDEYDRASYAYFDDPESDLARAFYYAEFNPKDAPRYLMRFSKVANFLQMPHISVEAEAEKEKGSALTESEKEELKSRVEVGKKWLAEYAPEDAKFSIKDHLPASASNLSPDQKKFLQTALQKLEALDNWEGQAIHTLLHEIKNEQQIPPKDAFSAIYRIFIDKDSGPQAGWFLGALDKEFVIKRVKEAIGE